MNPIYHSHHRYDDSFYAIKDVDSYENDTTQYVSTIEDISFKELIYPLSGKQFFLVCTSIFVLTLIMIKIHKKYFK